MITWHLNVLQFSISLVFWNSWQRGQEASAYRPQHLFTWFILGCRLKEEINPLRPTGANDIMDILIHRHVICKCIQHSWQPMSLNESTLGVAKKQTNKKQQQSTACNSVKHKNPKLGIIMNLIFTIDATCKIEHNNSHIQYTYIQGQCIKHMGIKYAYEIRTVNQIGNIQSSVFSDNSWMILLEHMG